MLPKHRRAKVLYLRFLTHRTIDLPDLNPNQFKEILVGV